MRKRNEGSSMGYKILIVDDEEGIVDSLAVVLKKQGYSVSGVTDPLEAVEKIRKEHYDILILDYMMQPIHGDKVVEKIREFNQELYILLLTGHKDLAPPFETLKSLDIQGYCEKCDKFEQLILLVESGIKSVSQTRAIQKYQKGLNSILKSVPQIYQLKPVKDILEEVLRDLMPIVNSQDAFILVDDHISAWSERKSIFKGIGKFDLNIDGFVSMLNSQLMEKVGAARASRQVVKMRSGVIFPLVNECNQSIGVLYIESCDFEENLKIMEIYASQVAASLSNAYLHSLVSEKSEELVRTYDRLRIRYMDVISALRLAVDAKDFFTRGHSDRVAYYSVKIGEMLGLGEKELECLKVGGVFHDIGKIGTSDDVLLKKENLNVEEMEEIKKHPVKGANILSAVSMFNDIVPLVRYHHERMDGTGYPEGIKGDQIPYLTRIITVADAFDCFVSSAKSSANLKVDDARNELLEGCGKQFDETVVEGFLKVLDQYDKMQRELVHSYL